MIARRKRASRGRRQEYSYSPMIWITDGENRRQIWGGTFRTKVEAKTEERRLLDERDAGKNMKPAKITIAQLFDQYISDKRSKVKASTLQRSEELLANLRPLIGSVLATALKPAMISKAYGDLQQHLSKRTVKHAHWQLHGALATAVNWGQIPVNVADRVEPPEPDAFEGQALEPKDVASLLVSIRSHVLAPLVMLAIDSSAREGELLALRWTDVDFDARQIHIGRSLRRVGAELVFSEPKTKRSRRTVEISAPTLAALKAHRQRQIEQRLRLGELWADLDLVFTTDTGSPYDGSYISRTFKKLAEDAGLEKLRFHDLRHSGISLLLKSGEPMANVSRRAGHSSIGITVDIYGHNLGQGSSMATTMGAIIEKAVGDLDGWLANG